MRKHLLFYLFDNLSGVNSDFMKKYSQVFGIENKYMTMTPISFNNEYGFKLDLVLKVKV